MYEMAPGIRILRACLFPHYSRLVLVALLHAFNHPYH